MTTTMRRPIDATSFYTPDDSQKSAKKMKFFNDQIDTLLGEGYGEAKRLGGVEESRGQKMEDIVAGALPAANAPTWTDEAFNNALTGGSDAAGHDMLSGMNSLRSYLGGAGVTGGGLAAGLATNLELGRLGQVTDSRRALFLERTKQDALDKARNFQNALTYANAVNRPPSTVYADFLADATNFRGQQLGAEYARDAGKKARKAGKDAGELGAIGGIGGALIGALL